MSVIITISNAEQDSLSRPLHGKKCRVRIALEILQEVVDAMLRMFQQGNGLHLSEVGVIMVLVNVFPESLNAVKTMED